MAIISVAVQLASVTSDDMGGVSGQDSIIQAFVSTFDVSTGILFLFYHWNFLWSPDPGERTALRRWRFLHSHFEHHSEQIKISLRLSPLDFNSKVDRIGTLKYRQVCNELCIRGQSVTWTLLLKCCSNSSKRRHPRLAIVLTIRGGRLNSATTSAYS